MNESDHKAVSAYNPIAAAIFFFIVILLLPVFLLGYADLDRCPVRPSQVERIGDSAGAAVCALV
jgi:hypothetical protein